ncbi:MULTISPECIES: phosphate ABC transporter permease PstA [Limibacillus]|jgi:phosphate transport system permease protein|uniref:Phosphate transport system permease protein PstA n=1 Tax=Limibacillus halophilus TaxID=1579333 RepID=A0A839SMG4_9PROT|nr:phosphate ABC transporter permease PstA [Limibacillus halophilus]MBB3064087.1 phosphate transport system permease protein [Limibacillus halophilus]
MASMQSPQTAKFDWFGKAQEARRRRRHAADRRLQFYGIAAIGTAILLLGVLLVSLMMNGSPAFTQSHVTFQVFVDPAKVEAEDPGSGDFRGIVRRGFEGLVSQELSRRDGRDFHDMLSRGAQYMLRDTVVENPRLIGQTITVTYPFADPMDQLHKGLIDRDTPESQRRVSDKQIAWYDEMAASGAISKPFNWALFFNADSRFPELAGLAGALVGSFYALMVCFLISFPVGVAAAVYLEEFAPRNRATDLIEVNINNLAAVPSVVFGLLGLAVFLNFFGLPRSSPLVGGMVLSLMTLPTMIIVTRAALKAVPPSIREAALGVGASRHQVVMHHVLPLAIPGILTGTIIGLAQALGETAPLLLIGMNAFITSAPGGITEPATALPTQVFIWADSPERGFVSRTSAAILVLIGFLIVMNGVAVFLRQRLERKW